MRAILIDRFGGPDVMRMTEVPVPDIGPDDVLIRVVCASANPADWKCREGWLNKLGHFHGSLPHVLGFDAAGTVEKVGAGVTAFRPGQRVYTFCNQGTGRWGSYAEFVAATQATVAPMPDSLGFAEAAAIPTAGLTAWQGLFDVGGTNAGDKVLVHGGAGGVGSYGIQFARMVGAEVATTCSAGNADYVRGLGAQRVIDYRSEDVLKAALAWAPGGVDVLLDAIGLATLPQAIDMVRPGGALVNVATLADIPGPEMKRAEARGVRMVDFAGKNRALAQEDMIQIAQAHAEGKVKPPAIRVFPLEQIAEVHRLLEAGHVRGKLVLQVA